MMTMGRKSGLIGFVAVGFVFMAATVFAVPRDIVVHRDGKTRVEGTIVEETAETIVIQTKLHDKPLHFRKSDLVQVIRGFDPDAPQTTEPEQPPTYDYRVYVPQGPVDPLRPPQQVVVIAELIRRGLTPPPATPTVTRTPVVMAQSSPASLPSASPAPSPQVTAMPGPTPAPPATPILVTPEPVGERKPVEERMPTSRPTWPTAVAIPSPAVAVMSPSSTPTLTPVPSFVPATPAATAFAHTPPVQASSAPVGAGVPSPAPVSGDSLLAQLLPMAQPVPTASSASYVGATPAVVEASPQAAGQKEVGRVSSCQGAVSCKRGSASVAVAAGTALSVGDTLETAADANAVVRLSSAHVLILGPASAATLLRADTGSPAEVGLVKGFVWVVADASNTLPAITVAVAGCGVTPDPSNVTPGVGFRIGVGNSGKLLLYSQRGKLLLADSVVDGSFTVEAGKPVAYLPGSRKLEPQPEVGEAYEKEWATVTSMAMQAARTQ